MKDVLLRLITALVAKGVLSVDDLRDVDEFIDFEFSESYEPAGRLVSPRKIKCTDSTGNPCQVITSIRGEAISIRGEGGDQWAHITKELAMLLGRWLTEASKD